MLTLRPITIIRERVSRARSDSDTALFHDLLYAGELTVRLATSAVVAAIDDERDRHRYRLLHALVRADGIGEWSRALEDALNGPASQHLVQLAKEDRRILTERLGSGTWQYEAVRLLSDVQAAIEPNRQPPSTKLAARAWFTNFAELRNKTRGHGAPTSALCSKVCEPLEESIRLILDNAPIFLRPWAYLHRNFSGKYRVVPLGGDQGAFDYLKTSHVVSNFAGKSGVYVFFDKPRHVELIYTNADVSDFLFPNGAFNGKKFELHSLITDNRMEGDAAPYLNNSSELPESETHGVNQLDIIGNVWTNLPPSPIGYVRRPEIEREFASVLENDRHPIVTLVGRGGIGKTSLALRMLHDIAEKNRFEYIIWLSARDIDLMPCGPKIVRPNILTDRDVSERFVDLMGLHSDINKERKASEVLENCLRTGLRGGAILFVFDNFETVRSPIDVFGWIDTNVRLPNKVLITTRFRDFKADYPITIGGMTEVEAIELIDQTADSLRISDALNASYKKEIFEDSDGHPYVIKIMLGEIADTKRPGRPKQILARKDDILDALFDRTYSNLSPLASRLFLTLCGWRSLVPQLALEAVVLRNQPEQLDAASAIDELVRMSLAQRRPASDGVEFLEVPLAAAIFGSRKLSSSPQKFIIDNDIKLLRELGPSNAHTLKNGSRTRIEALFKKIASSVSEGGLKLEEMQPVLEFIARGYPPAWLLLADLFEEVQGLDGAYGADQVMNYVRIFVESEVDGPEVRKAWERLSNLYRRADNLVGACGAFIRASQLGNISLAEISNMANWMNNNRTLISELDAADKASIFSSLSALMENRIRECSATDLSRLAWLHLHAGDAERARQVAELGLSLEPGNSYCQRLINRLADP